MSGTNSIRDDSRCTGPSGNPLLPIWSPADTAALRASAEAFPTEIGQSPMLRLILDREGISL